MEIHQPSGPKSGRGRLQGGGRLREVPTVRLWPGNLCLLYRRSLMGGGRLREVIAFGGSTVHPFPVTVKEHTFPDILQSFDLYSKNFIEVLCLKRNSPTTFSNPNTGRILNIIHLQCANQRCQISPPTPPPPHLLPPSFAVPTNKSNARGLSWYSLPFF